MYCIKCKENTQDKDQEIKKSKNNRFYSVSKCSKCNNKKIQFIKNPQDGQDGEGLKDIIKNVKAAVRGPRNDYPPLVRTLMSKLKDEMITGVEIGRDPISPGKIINLLTFGRYREALKKLEYDDMYHLYAILTLEDKRRYRVEKNEVIRIKDYNDTPNESIKINLNNPIRWEDFFLNGKDFHEKNLKKNFYLYNGTNNNCQKFIMSLLQGNDIGTPEDYKFIEQDVPALLKELEGDYQQQETESEGGILSKIANFGTDLAARWSIIQEGEGKKKKKK